MGFIFLPLIFTGVLVTLGIYLRALYSRSVGGESQNDLWKGTTISASVTILLMLLYTAVSSTVGIADIFTGILLMATAGLVLSLLFNRNYKNKYNERGKFNRTTGITLGLMVLSFVVIGLSADPEGTEEHLDSGEIAVEAGIDEMTEEEDAEETEAEKQAEEEQAAEKAEAEKQAEEEQAAEKAEAEKQAEEEQAAEETEAEKQTEEEDVVKDGLIPVQLYRVVDGDTVHVIDEDGNNLNLRLLLIDTPETVHPNEPVQPYGPEASERLTDLLNGAGQLYIEYDDDGDKQDHYGRELVYLYADDVNVHEVLLEEGLARVGYIYEQQRYLEGFRAAEQYAKDNGLGIWSIPGYVNEDGEGFNYEEEPAAEDPADDGTGTNTGSYDFANCTELREVFPDGVPSDHPAYQSKMDRDNDGYACEISSSSSAETSIEEPADTSADTGNYDFANCTELREVFPDGVPSDHPAYQSTMDRDNDGHACE